MWNLPWKIHVERRPRPLPPDFYELLQMVVELTEVVAEVRKMAEATQRKVYRDDKGDHEGQGVDIAAPGTTAPADTEWRTGDPAA